MNLADFQRLLRFYISCIEAEDRRSLRRKLSSLHHSLVSVWDTEEPMFYPEATEVVFEANVSDQKVLEGGATFVGGPDRFFYGYPVYLDKEGFLAPLFVASVVIDRQAPKQYVMHLRDSGDIEVNHHLFRARHTQSEELRAIQGELEGPFGSFGDRLKAALELLGMPSKEFPRNQLDPYPRDTDARDRWINRPILFRSERNPYTIHVRRELEDLASRPYLLSEVGKTALASFLGLNPTPLPHGQKQVSVSLLPILPLNGRQEEAARAGLKESLCVVTGPPGTGKSQIVIVLLASCAASGVPVLFSSKNNKAVDVVRERLRTIHGEERDFTLRLGNREHMNRCREEMETRLQHPGISEVPVPPSPRILYNLDEEIAQLRRRIGELQEIHLKATAIERDRRLAEGLVPLRWVKDWPENCYSMPDSARLDKLVEIAESLAGKRPASLWRRIRRFLFPKTLERQLRLQLETIVADLPEYIKTDVSEALTSTVPHSFEIIANVARDLSRLGSWRFAVKQAENTLSRLAEMEPANVIAVRLEELLERRAALARDQFRAIGAGRIKPRAEIIRHLLSRYFNLTERILLREGQRSHQYAQQFNDTVRDLCKDLPVWIVTNLSTGRALPLEPATFDLVIIDEASQSDIPSALPLLFRARRAMIIGDPRQLRHISTIDRREEDQLASEHQVAHLFTEWSYSDRSLYNLSEGIVLERGGRPFFLAEHYRSHPKIAEFSNTTFYAGQLIMKTPIERLRNRLGGEPLGVFWHDVQGEVPHSSRSAFNELEVKAVIDLLGFWANSGFLLRNEISFGVVTPFHLQMERIDEAIRQCPWWEDVKGRLTVGTVHRFQGDECDVMIFSPVVAQGMSPRLSRWVADTDQLLNVALTRARASLHVVGDKAACLAAGSYLGQYAAAAEGGSSGNNPASYESPAEAQVAELLKEVGIWFAPQHKHGRYRFDFIAVSPLGNRYDIEVDGRQHLTDEAIHADEIRDAEVSAAGIKVLRLDARRVFQKPELVREILRRLA